MSWTEVKNGRLEAVSKGHAAMMEMMMRKFVLQKAIWLSSDSCTLYSTH